MKKLLLSTVLAFLAAPAYAAFILTTDPTGLPPDFTPGGDEVQMFLDEAKDTNLFFGSTTGNGIHSTDSVLINTTGYVDTSSGFATIKPIKDGTLTDLIFTPQSGFTFDGFFTRGQLEWTDPSPCAHSDHSCVPNVAPTTANVWMSVNGGTPFSFAEPTPWTNDFAFIGFDEDPGSEATATLIKSVHMYVTDPNISFFEVKQEGWSVCNGIESGCDVVINPTGGAPEPSTWAMGLMGFGLIGLVGLYRTRREARYAL